MVNSGLIQTCFDVKGVRFGRGRQGSRSLRAVVVLGGQVGCSSFTMVPVRQNDKISLLHDRMDKAAYRLSADLDGLML